MRCLACEQGVPVDEIRISAEHARPGAIIPFCEYHFQQSVRPKERYVERRPVDWSVVALGLVIFFLGVVVGLITRQLGL